MIIIQLNILQSGKSVGSAIGKPQPLDLTKVNASAPQSGSKMAAEPHTPAANQPRPGGSFNSQHTAYQPQLTGAYKPGQGIAAFIGLITMCVIIDTHFPIILGGGGGGGGGSASSAGSRGFGGGGGGGGPTMTSPGGTPLSQRTAIPISSLNPYQNKCAVSHTQRVLAIPPSPLHSGGP